MSRPLKSRDDRPLKSREDRLHCLQVIQLQHVTAASRLQALFLSPAGFLFVSNNPPVSPPCPTHTLRTYISRNATRVREQGPRHATA